MKPPVIAGGMQGSEEIPIKLTDCFVVPPRDDG
jgi:hypothetical protein